MFTNISILIGIHLLAEMSPGPDFFLVIKHSLLYSRKNSFATALGISCGCLIIMLTVIISIVFIGNTLTSLIYILHIFGSLYLMYLGLMSAKEAYHIFKSKKIKFEYNHYNHSLNTESTKEFNQPNNSPAENQHSNSFAFYFFSGLLCNILNPKAWIYFLSIFVATIHNYNHIQIALIITILFTISLGWFSALGITLNTSFIKKKFQSYQQLVMVFSAVGFFVVGIILGMEAIIQ